jgi:hypothetical protein
VSGSSCPFGERVGRQLFWQRWVSAAESACGRPDWRRVIRSSQPQPALLTLCTFAQWLEFRHTLRLPSNGPGEIGSRLRMLWVNPARKFNVRVSSRKIWRTFSWAFVRSMRGGFPRTSTRRRSASPALIAKGLPGGPHSFPSQPGNGTSVHPPGAAEIDTLRSPPQLQ